MKTFIAGEEIPRGSVLTVGEDDKAYRALTNEEKLFNAVQKIVTAFDSVQRSGLRGILAEARELLKVQTAEKSSRYPVMNVYTIPDYKLKHFLIMIDMNFDLKEPYAIFQVEKTFQVVLMEAVPSRVDAALNSVIDLWTKERECEHDNTVLVFTYLLVHIDGDFC